MKINNQMREMFDQTLEQEIQSLPPEIAQRLEEVFVNAMDAPTAKHLERLGSTRPEDLLGTYTGVPLTRRGVHDSMRLPDTIVLFRLGILLRSRQSGGDIDEQKLRKLIRKTLLHEIGHLHGMDEQDLSDHGYA